MMGRGEGGEGDLEGGGGGGEEGLEDDHPVSSLKPPSLLTCQYLCPWCRGRW